MEDETLNDCELCLFTHRKEIVEDVKRNLLAKCVLEDGDYCWQKCGAVEHCHECEKLGNGYINHFETLAYKDEKMEKEKRVTDIIQEVKNDICSHYCKWPEYYKVRFETYQKNEDDIFEEKCDKCPLNRL